MMIKFEKLESKEKILDNKRINKLWLEMTESEKDLGMMASRDRRDSKQVETAVSKVNRTLGNKTFKFVNIKLFKTLLRNHI